MRETAMLTGICSVPYGEQNYHLLAVINVDVDICKYPKYS